MSKFKKCFQCAGVHGRRVVAYHQVNSLFVCPMDDEKPEGLRTEIVRVSHKSISLLVA